MSEPGPQTVLCIFRVAKGQDEALLELCRQHEVTLRKLGFCSDEPTTLHRGTDHGGGFIFKQFQWKNAAALEAARQHPEVQQIWEAMEPLCENRGGQPSMEFPHIEPVRL